MLVMTERPEALLLADSRFWLDLDSSSSTQDSREGFGRDLIVLKLPSARPEDNSSKSSGHWQRAGPQRILRLARLERESESGCFIQRVPQQL